MRTGKKREKPTAFAYLGAAGAALALLALAMPLYHIGVELPDGSRDDVVTVYAYKPPKIDFTKKTLDAIKSTGGNGTGTRPTETESTARSTQAKIEDNVRMFEPVCYVGALVFVVISLAAAVKALQVKRSRRRGNILIGLGAFMLALAVVFILAFKVLPGMFLDLENTESLVSAMEANPLSGSAASVVEGGRCEVFWQVGWGVWILIASGATVLAGGVGERVLGGRIAARSRAADSALDDGVDAAAPMDGEAASGEFMGREIGARKLPRVKTKGKIPRAGDHAPDEEGQEEDR